ncbi:MAG: hypothetical protein LC789_11300 [Actinobacteria bacterium]|nr:hypothetical protein [Actinomycetota bacterium]MCA1721144.1 hypothetical protein [Actinomycetota bacterium]
MSLSDELRDPWGLVAGGVSGGMAWALAGATLASGPAIALGVGVGAVVLGVKAVSGLLVNREPARPGLEIPRPPRGSAAAGWLRRAEAAVRSLDEMAATTTAGPTGLAVSSAADEAGDTLTDLSRVAAQVTAVESALRRVDVHGLDAEAARLEAAAHRARTPEVEAEIRRSAAAVRDRLEVRDRLRGARETLLARMEAATLGLEGLGARLAEVLALTATTGGVDTSAAQISDLALELEGLRAGLAETEALSRRALDAAPD